MRIERIETRAERIPLSRPYTIAFRTIDAIEIGFVVIRAEGGLLGLGSASPEAHVTGETEAMCRASLAEERLAWLVGRDARQLPALLRELERPMAATPAARAAVDIALHDLHARWLGLPLADALGRAHEKLPTSITIGIQETGSALDEAQEYIARGFRILKVKIGRDLDADLERLRKLRERVGRGVGIRVDANQGYTWDQVARLFEQTQDLDLEFVEQPVAAAETQTLASLPEAMRRRIAADESLLSERDALALAAPPRPCGIFNIKLMKCGGIGPARGIARIAELAGIDLMWGCMDESRVSIAAALHAAFASPPTRHLDLDGSFDLARDPVSGGFVLEGGFLRTTAAPGLGVEWAG
jgi:L-alanine-DL-glutamate epimerase-like enolase superfamily enzyme